MEKNTYKNINYKLSHIYIQKEVRILGWIEIIDKEYFLLNVFCLLANVKKCCVLRYLKKILEESIFSFQRYFGAYQKTKKCCISLFWR